MSCSRSSGLDMSGGGLRGGGVSCDIDVATSLSREYFHLFQIIKISTRMFSSVDWTPWFEPYKMVDCQCQELSLTADCCGWSDFQDAHVLYIRKDCRPPCGRYSTLYYYTTIVP